MNDELLGLLLHIKQTLISSGTFESFEYTDDSSELPFVYDKLESAIALLTQDGNNGFQSGYLH